MDREVPGTPDSPARTHVSRASNGAGPVGSGSNSQPILISDNGINRNSSTSRSASNRRQSASGGVSGQAGASVGRRPSRATHPPVVPPKALSHEEALEALRGFLKERSSYDVFPVSFRLIVLDVQLKVKKALDVMLLYGVVSAPLWNTEVAKFADVIHLIQYYYHTNSWEGARADVEQIRLESIRDVEKTLQVPPPPLLSVHPLRPLYDACRFLIRTHARRLPLIDKDPQTDGEVVISVLTQYRVLKFIALNVSRRVLRSLYQCRDITQYLTAGVQELGIGTYADPNPPAESDRPFYPIATASLQTTVFDVVHMFSELGISAVPIVDENGMVINLYETVDVITLVRNGAYTALDLTIAQALKQRALDFPGVVTCNPKDSLSAVFSLIKIRRVHRLVVVEGRDSPTPGKLVGVISLSDIMRALIGNDVPIGGSGVGAEPIDKALRAEAAETATKAEEGVPAAFMGAQSI